ncbi:MAG TPA: LLM class flavin-dependent oxidoreductase [Caulobacteraceae bacterium]|jgi:alkanesulfonate monooxygenase SsuD/methylene tetrahydromethanopterin reductase-like flavin-dependent oxidoreductase (luciferase family)
MKFGIFDHLERRHDCDLTQQYEERLQLMAQADEAGVYGYHIAEHHHSPLCLAPNQSVFLAAAAQRTKRLKIGTLVYVLPLYQPIRILEETCMVDRLSNGRLQVGVGRGAGGGGEIALWGGQASDSDGLFRETLEILLKGYQNEFLSHDGEHYKYKNLWMELRSVQKPHPAFWYAGNPQHAGELGMNFIGAGPIRRVQGAVQTYLAAWKEGQAKPGPCTATLAQPLYGAMRHMFIADTDAEAKDRARVAYEAYRRHFAKPQPRGAATAAAALDRAAGAAPPTPVGPQPARLGGPASFSPDEAMAGESLLVGSPSTIRDYVRRYAAESGANYYVGSFSWGDLTHAESSKSLRLFAEEVMPAVETATAEA